MELSEHTCISCAFLCESGDTIISSIHREGAPDDKKWNSGGINYQRLVCHMGKQNYSGFDIHNAVIDIRNEVIKANKCKNWTRFIGISPMAVEQRKSFKWAKFAFWVAITTLAAVLITWILSQFILK